MTQRVSVDSSGAQGNGICNICAISANGRFVAFESYASNLVPGDINGVWDVFVHDCLLGTTERVSVDSSGVQGNGGSYYPSISADGRLIAFTSDASNLVVGDSNGRTDIFVHDRLSGATGRVNVNSAGMQANFDSANPMISANGRFVVFVSIANNLVSGDTNGWRDVFVSDLQLGTLERVSVATGGAQSNGDCSALSISPDGRYVAFQGFASDLVANDTNAASDLFLRDRLLGTTERVSVDSAGAQSNNGSSSSSISADGRFVAFRSSASNLVAGDANGADDIFLRDRQNGTTERMSVSTSGAQGNLPSYEPSISADGRFVAFFGTASNLVAGDTNGSMDVFVRDRLSGTTSRWSVATSGAQGNTNSYAYSPTISEDGRFVAFAGSASNLVTGDTNATTDVFVRDNGVPLPFPFCSGDGSATACPCANAGAAGNGCASSVSPLGANLSWSGNPSIAADTFVLRGTGMPDSSALYFQGTTPQNGGAGSHFGDGLRCAGGTIIRLGTKTNVGASSHFPEVGDPSISVRGLVTAPGMRTYQAWYRNATAFCQPETFNLTNGLSVTWGT